MTEPRGHRDEEGEARAPPRSSASRLPVPGPDPAAQPGGTRMPLPVVAQRPQVHVDRGGVRAGRALEGEQQRFPDVRRVFSSVSALTQRCIRPGAPVPATVTSTRPDSIGETPGNTG